MKGKIKGKNINAVSAVLLSIFMLAFVAGMGYWYYIVSHDEAITPQFLYEQANAAINKMPYAHLVISRREVSESFEYNFTYNITAERDGTYSSYSFTDSDGIDVYECWDWDEEKAAYETYLYDKDMEAWVMGYMSEVPLAVGVWDMFEYIDDYELLDGTWPWIDTNEECYVLFAHSTVLDDIHTYEDIYIRVSDFMPLGIIDIVAYPTEGLEQEDIVSAIKDEDVLINLSEYYSQYNWVVQKYSLTTSTEDLRMFDKPEKFLTEGEYMFLLEGELYE